jgi:hypothetical protein
MKSPVIQSDVKNCLYFPHLWTSVVFRDISELDRLIVALQQLREAFDDPSFHVHLQDEELGDSCSFEQAEIVFHSSAVYSLANEATERLRDASNLSKLFQRFRNTESFDDAGQNL